MQKKTSFKKVVCLTTALSFGFAVLYPYTSRANPLSPISFDEMYSLAQRGDVESLRASVRRGMNIDVMKSNGDTGLCIAAKNHDSYTYNAFRAAGANPRHPCTMNIPDYQNFVESSRAVPVTAVPREAYSEVGRESYSVSPRVWWVLGGLALIGGVTAIVLSHKSGGKSKHSSSGDDGHKEDYNSLGAIAATDGKTSNKTSGMALNSKKVTVTNSKITQAQANSINLTADVLSNTNYLFQGFLAQKGGSYTNKAAGIIELGSATIGMTALKESEIINNGYIKANSFNATVAMVASEDSRAVNNAYGIISDESTLGIDLNFKGDSATKTVVGMYADTNSQLVNNGDIRGTATKAITESSNSGTDENGLVSILDELIEGTTATVSTTAIKGQLIGMEAMILNTGSDVRDNRIILTNTRGGHIKLSAGDSGTTSTTINLMTVGMGSFLDTEFLDGSKNINRAESVILTNEGIIEIAYTGRYEAASDAPLRKGTGGIAGMRAEANTTATNEENAFINITLTDNFSDSGSYTATNDKGVDTSAGMQSLHGASMTNNGTIKIVTNAQNPVVNYGMIAAEGSGNVSGLYTRNKQVLDNNGTIYIEASNSYGMASYNGGTLNNNKGAIIVVGKDMSDTAAQNDADTQYTNNIAMYGADNSTAVTLNNFGEIHVYSQNSTAMRNDFAGAQEIRNENVIHLHSSATDSVVFAGYYSRLVNNGTITYDLSEPGNPSEIGSADDPFENYSTTPSSGSERKSVMTTKSLGESSSSTTEALYNNAGKEITMNGSAYTSVMSVETMRGYAINEGEINLKQNQFRTEGNGIGMYADSSTISAAYIQNLGIINSTSYMSAAMASESTQNAAVINDGIINMKHDYSMGMYANGKSLLTNNLKINIDNSNSVAIYTTEAGSSNIINSKTGTIRIGAQTSILSNVYGLFSNGASSVVSNYGIIEIYGNNSTAIKVTGDESIVINDNEISGIYTTGIESSGKKVRIENLRGNDTQFGQIHGALQYGIYTTGDETTINNVGDIGEEENGPSIGIYTTGRETNITNTADGRIYASNTGIYTTGDETTASNVGIIGSETAGPVYGIYAEGSKSNLSNTGTIYASFTGMQATKENSTILNAGFIGSTNFRPLYGIYADKQNVTITNNSTIYATNMGIYALEANATIVNFGAIGSSDSKPNFGICADGQGADITNNSTIYASNMGIYAMGNSSVISNSGIIGSENSKPAYSIRADGQNVKITNSNAIYASNTAIYAMGDGVSVTNSGTIGSETARPAYSIRVDGQDAKITNSNTIYASSTGIYAMGDGVSVTNSGTIGSEAAVSSYGIRVDGQNAKIINESPIYASNMGIYALESNATITNSGTIGSADNIPFYGIRADKTGATITNESQIYASNTGIYALEANATITNSGAIGSTDNRPIYGIRADGRGSKIINNRPIYASNTGIYAYATAESQTKVENNSYIEAGSYGIYAVVDSASAKLNIANNGTIVKTGAENGIIYIKHLYERPETPPEDYEKDIIVDPVGDHVDRQDSYEPPSTGTSSALFALSSRQISVVNTGMIRTTSAFNFDDEEVAYAVGQNGSYQAPSLSGTVLASAAIVQDGFEDVYTNTNSFIGEDEGIHVVSASYMYDANAAQNEKGNTDIVLTRKPFAELTNNASLAAFLERNYANKNNDALYQNLKAAAEGNSFAKALNKHFALDTIPNFAKQNLDAERILNTEINSDLLQKTEQENRHISKITIYKNDVDGKGGVSGYKDRIISAYGIRDTRINNNWRVGLGLSVLRADTDYDNDADRYNNVMEIMVPVTFEKENLSAVIKPKAGFGRGHYRRPTQDEVYKADTKEYYYGTDTAAKYTADFDVVTLEPNVGFSLTGMYSESMREKTGGLKVKNKNIVSALSSVGLDVGKAFEITRNQSVSLGAGSKYYHEFGNKYTNKVFVTGMDGFYKMNSNRFNRNFGLMNFKAGYEYGEFAVQASVNVPVETKHNTYYMLNLGYKF